MVSDYLSIIVMIFFLIHIKIRIMVILIRKSSETLITKLIF